MSGDNLYGKQPVKFYSENITLTKLILIERHFNFKYQINDESKPDQKYIELKNLLAS
tara:strand:+ start:834 stop:1004 length:171 start_codon:yes stop_codon:yes gene_type:complete